MPTSSHCRTMLSRACSGSIIARLRSTLIDRRLWLKIPLDDELADLRLQSLDLLLVIALPLALAAAERLLHPVQRLTLPLGDHVRVYLVSSGEFSHRPVAADRRQRYLCLKLRGKVSSFSHRS